MYISTCQDLLHDRHKKMAFHGGNFFDKMIGHGHHSNNQPLTN